MALCLTSGHWALGLLLIVEAAFAAFAALLPAALN